ncbi:Amidohydrolase 2 [Sphingomonas paucimobilis]|nr:Amidohydrolase 2 [Sphingomonas paucimobilis]
MKLIGIEEHYLTTDVRDAWEAIGLASTDPSVSIHSGHVERRLLDLAGERLSLMDETGLDVQVLSLTTPALHDQRGSRPALLQRVEIQARNHLPTSIGFRRVPRRT